MNDLEKAKKIVDMMFNQDPFSRELGMEVKEISQGFCKISMKIRKDMLNGFSVAHGSLTYALADSALAFASNTHGQKCMSIDTQISHLKPVFQGDELTAQTQEINRSRNLARYSVQISNQKGDLVAHFQGTVFIKEETWF